MTFPELDSQDYITNHDRSKPIEMPKEVYVVYYLGLQGDWIWSLPSFYLENAHKHASALDRPTKILTYKLTDEVEVTSQDRIDWKPKRARRVRKPTSVPKPKMKRVRRIAE